MTDPSAGRPPVRPGHAAFAAGIDAAQDVLDAFMTAWNARDAAGVRASFNFPHVRFARFRPDGSLISAFDSIYIVTLQDGRWGVQGRSSYAP